MLWAQEMFCMGSFDERGDTLEAKFAHDQELRFKMIAKRNYRLGIWAAGLLGKEDNDAEANVRTKMDSLLTELFQEEESA